MTVVYDSMSLALVRGTLCQNMPKLFLKDVICKGEIDSLRLATARRFESDCCLHMIKTRSEQLAKRIEKLIDN